MKLTAGVIAMSRIIYVVHTEDALPWATFIKNLFLKQRSSKYEVRSVLITDLANSSSSSARLDIEGAEVLVAVLSPEHLHYLSDHLDFTYQGLVRGGQKGVLFFCGTSVSDLEGKEPSVKDLQARFPSYKDWAAVQHTDANSLARVLDKIQPLPGLVYQLIPDRVRCENGSTVTVSFSEVIAAKPTDLQMALYISQDDSASEENVEVTWMNDKTMFFKAPERREGPAKVRVVVKGNQIPGTSNLLYESSCELISEMMQLYIHAMDHLFSLVLSKSLISNTELDAFLFKIFTEDEPQDIQPKAFEELFGIYRYNPDIKSHVELPTLLHFANKFGLEKFHSWLDNLPDATLASKVQNCEGLQAEKVNKFKTKASVSPASSHPPFKLPVDEDLYETEDYYLDMETTTKIRNENKKKGALGNSVEGLDVPIMASDKTEGDSDEDECNGDYEIFEDTYTTIPSFCEYRPKSIEEEEEEEEEKTECLPQMPSSQDNRPAAQSGATTDPGQLKLIEIMTQVKRGELSMEEANIFFEEWKIQHSQKPLQPNLMPRSKQAPKEIPVPLKPSVISKDAKSSPALPESLPPRLGRKRGSDASDKTSSTASSGSFDSSHSSTNSSIYSHSSGIDIDLIDDEVRSARSSDCSIDGNTVVPPPLPSRDIRPVPSKSTTLPKMMPGLSKFEGMNGKSDKTSYAQARK